MTTVGGVVGFRTPSQVLEVVKTLEIDSQADIHAELQTNSPVCRCIERPRRELIKIKMNEISKILPRQQQVLEIPFNLQLGIKFDGMWDGIAKSHFLSSRELATFDGYLHGGVLSAVVEVAGFLALAPYLNDQQHAVTHDLHVSFMRPIPTGVRCDLHASVSRFGRTLAFLEVTAYVAEKIVASAHITKSIIEKK